MMDLSDGETFTGLYSHKKTRNNGGVPGLDGQ
jgi:hypothetical protein